MDNSEAGESQSPGIDVVHAAAWYLPYDVGGTEVYLEGLIDGLRAKGVRSRVLVPKCHDAPERYTHSDTIVETYKPIDRSTVLKSELDEFRQQLRAYAGAIYHQHSWTPDCGSDHLRIARELGFKTALTVHVPGNICLRGTMLQFGVQPCHGRVAAQLCGACWAHDRGLPRPLADIIAAVPPIVARAMPSGAGRWGTALSARSLAIERIAAVREMITNADRVVAVCQWLYDVLAANGVPRRKLVLSRQGIGADAAEALRKIDRRQRRPGPLRLLYVGRWHSIKGVDVVVRAVRALPSAIDVQLEIRAVAPIAGEEGYVAKVRGIAGPDPRIVFKPAFSRDQLAAVLAEHDALVVPSLWLETGPLVVLEAQAAGLYVLGSRLGGIAELVEQCGGGKLVEAGNVAAWAAAIADMAGSHITSDRPRPSGVARTMDDAAGEMIGLYETMK